MVNSREKVRGAAQSVPSGMVHETPADPNPGFQAVPPIEHTSPASTSPPASEA